MKCNILVTFLFSCKNASPTHPTVPKTRRFHPSSPIPPPPRAALGFSSTSPSWSFSVSDAMTSYPSDYNVDRHSRFLLDIIDGIDPFERDPTFFDAKDPLGKAHAIAESQARQRSMEQSTKTPLSATPRELSRSPPPAGMLRILKWRAESEKPSTEGYTTRDSAMPKTAKDAKEARPQRTMAEIEAVLHPKVKNLERTRLVFQDALNDCGMCVAAERSDRFALAYSGCRELSPPCQALQSGHHL